MNKDLYRLEFNKVLDKVSTYCVTSYGKDLILNLTPSSDCNEVEKSLSETQSALELLTKKGAIPISEIENIEIYIKSLNSGSSLSAKAILDIANILKVSRELKDYFFSDTSFNLSNFKLIEDFFNTLYSNETLEFKIFSCILDENTIDDKASPALSSLRRNRKKLEHDVREKLSNFIHSTNYSKYIMDSIITIRNDRFVIPVKAEFKDKISGSILDVSSSGSTIYIEPSNIYDLNNKINSIKIMEMLEIEKILANLSSILQPISSNIYLSFKTIGVLDCIFAKAKYARAIDGICPTLNQNKLINLISARHPLIDETKVVPIDISIGNTYTSLLITGPNTGGKTATLKTTGLLVAMACSGIPIPAKENSSIYVFDNIFADIGDEQSIQDSLSTFSSHIVNIIEIINSATSNSLILVDELGSGTDPIEGSSLAISILEYFHKLGALTIATTHYPELKNYALVTNGFENASSDFDVNNLAPTYKLLIGVPGRSNAFAICKKLGIPEDILNVASTYLSKDTINIESLLKSIYDDKLKIEKEKENIIKNSNQVELLRKKLERDNSKLDADAQNIISDAKQKARDILLDAKDEANKIIKELNDEKINSSAANQLRNKLNSSISEISSINTYSRKTDISKSLSKDSIKIGQVVLVKKLNQSAIVLSLPNKSNEVQVQIGILKMNVKVTDIFPSTDNLHAKANPPSVSFNSNLKSQSISSELNVIGLNVDEAIPLIDKYLDDASIANLSSVRIVHGKGTGKLREGIHSFLKSHSHVSSFRLGTFGEGEMGVTIVSLK